MSAIVKVTENALRKHIVDATLPVQNFLRENNIHDFDSQELAKIERIPVRVIPSGKEILFRYKGLRPMMVSSRELG